MQEPDFGQGRDGVAMNKRFTKFKCNSIPNVIKGLDRLYERQAMEIIHWMAKETEGMDLFKNVLNKNPPYERRSPSFHEILERNKQTQPVADNAETPDIGELDSSILPNRTIEVRSNVTT